MNLVEMSWKVNIRLEDISLKRDEDIITISTKNIISSLENESIRSVAGKLVSAEHRRMPILSKKGQLVGIVTRSDILGAFLRDEDMDNSVSSIMTREVITCQEYEDIEYVLHKFKISRRGGFPVVARNRVIGMISERDFVDRMKGLNADISAEAIMTLKPFCVRNGISLLDCLKMMVNTHYRRMPVIDTMDKKLVGIVTVTDMLNYVHTNGYDKTKLDEDLEKVIKTPLTVLEKENIGNVISVMVRNDVGGVVVTDENSSMKGIITERDLVELLT